MVAGLPLLLSHVTGVAHTFIVLCCLQSLGMKAIKRGFGRRGADERKRKGKREREKREREVARKMIEMKERE